MPIFARILTLGFLATNLMPCAWSQDADLQSLNAIAADFQSRVKVHGIPDTAFLPPAKIRIYTTPPFSFYEKRTVTEARYSELPPPVQNNFNQWAAFTSDEPSGEALFRDTFYRFFFVHELGHWLQARVFEAKQPSGETGPEADEHYFQDDDYYQREVQSNRIAVAWWREHDPKYLSRLVADFRKIESHLPNPVPAGRDKVQYFIENYAKLGSDPALYGWYQLDMVIGAYDQPSESFQQVLDALPSVQYKRPANANSR
jgi:hypothetical protein